MTTRVASIQARRKLCAALEEQGVRQDVARRVATREVYAAKSIALGDLGYTVSRIDYELLLSKAPELARNLPESQ